MIDVEKLRQHLSLQELQAMKNGYVGIIQSVRALENQLINNIENMRALEPERESLSQYLAGVMRMPVGESGNEEERARMDRESSLHQRIDAIDQERDVIKGNLFNVIPANVAFSSLADLIRGGDINTDFMQMLISCLNKFVSFEEKSFESIDEQINT